MKQECTCHVSTLITAALNYFKSIHQPFGRQTCQRHFSRSQHFYQLRNRHSILQKEILFSINLFAIGRQYE